LDKLKKYMRNQNKSVSWLSKKIDRSTNTIYAYLSGKRNMPYKVAVKIEKLTNKEVTVIDIMK